MLFKCWIQLALISSSVASFAAAGEGYHGDAGPVPKTIEACAARVEGQVPAAAIDAEILMPETLGLRPLPALPADLGDEAALSRYMSEVMSVINANSVATSQAFFTADERTENFYAIRREMEVSKPGDPQTMRDLFGEFNAIGERIALPDEFTPSNAASQVPKTVKSLLRTAMNRFGLQKALPPTVEQWLAIYANEKPDFERVAERVQAAINELARRRELSLSEIEKFEALIQEAERQVEDYRAGLEALEERLASSGLSDEQRRHVRDTAQVLIAEEIQGLQSQIAVHRTLIVQKRVFIAESDPAMRLIGRTASTAIVGLRNSAITQEDALLLKQGVEAAAQMREILRRSIAHTTRTLGETSRRIDELNGQAVFTREEFLTNIRALLETVRQSREAAEQEMPRLNQSLAEYDAALAQAKNELKALPPPK